MFVNINNKKRKNKIKAIHVSYSAIMAAVCHMTSMTRHHGNNNAKQSKITVAWKKLDRKNSIEYFKLTCERVKEINSIISKFIWNDKCPRIKLTTLQHPNSAGGLAVPNFELYYWSFQLKALHNWVDPQSTVSWRVIEADKVKPNRLQHILFTGTGKKGDNYKFGPVVANSIKIWKTVERRIGGPFKFCNSTPLWHNFNFVCGNRPFVQPSWSSLGVNTCGDIYDNQGLCSFQTLRTKFCLPASAYFVFLQLPSALKAYGSGSQTGGRGVMIRGARQGSEHTVSWYL